MHQNSGAFRHTLHGGTESTIVPERTSAMRFLPALLVVLALANLAAADDLVSVRDRTGKSDKPTSVIGTITAETVAGVKLKPGVGPEKDIPAGDILDVVYEVRPAARLRYNSAMQNEAKKTGPDSAKVLAEAEKDYAGVAAQLNDEKSAKILRHIQYKLALIKVCAGRRGQGEATRSRRSARQVPQAVPQ